MRVSWKWLNELIKIKMKPEELGTLMTMSGVAVEGIEYLDKGVKGVKVGFIREVKKHPEADKLVICVIDTGEEKLWNIVSGASNLMEGLKVPVALPGSVLPGDKRIDATTFRGILSEGMLCSGEELGLDADKLPADQKDGIYILTPEVQVGADIVDVLGLDDIILELELTPNRSDCLSMINVAYEVAALIGGKVNLPIITRSQTDDDCTDAVSIEIDDPSLCKRYVARLIKDIKIQSSPIWLQHRLLAAGIRPISNIVDITNYVMLETGQPLHAFDYDLLGENKIIVRRARENEVLKTLDGQSRKLNPEMLVIADADKPVGLAGVMGGLDTEVTSETRNILLESAHFNGANIRRTAQALGMRSEASLRFEKNLDIQRTPIAADRAVDLIKELGAGIPVPGHVDCYPVQDEITPISLRLTRVNDILGTDLDGETIERILKSLRVEIIEYKNDSWLVTAPSYRGDLEKEIDLIEEIARLYGYDKIPTTLPYGPTTQGARTWEQKVTHKIWELMSNLGLMEVITYSFINPRHLDYMGLPAGDILRDAVPIKNPLSEEQGIMRTTMLPGLLDTIKKNLNKRNRNIKIYEMGKVYYSDGFPNKELPMEKMVLGAAVTGTKEKSWSYGEEVYDFFYLKGVMEALIKDLGISDIRLLREKDIRWLHPGRGVRLFIREKEVGFLGEIHPLVLENYGIDQRVTAFSLDVETLIQEASEKIMYRQLARYPSVSRDLAVVVPERINAGEVAAVIRETGGQMLKSIRLFDLYRGKQITEGHKSLAYSLTWQSEERTLTDEEIRPLHLAIEEILNDKFEAGLRR